MPASDTAAAPKTSKKRAADEVTDGATNDDDSPSKKIKAARSNRKTMKAFGNEDQVKEEVTEEAAGF